MKNKTPETSEQVLQQLLVDQLKDLYSAENQLIKALPKMSKAANSSELKSAFDDHLRVTQEQASRIENIFEKMNQKIPKMKCKGMEGLVAEGEETINKHEENPMIKDSEIIAAAQRVEHYEIAGYGTARTFAEKLGMDETVQLLQQTLDEEGEADKTLTAISENLLSSINAQDNDEA